MDGFHQQIGVAPRDAVEPMQLFADTVDPLLEKAAASTRVASFTCGPRPTWTSQES